MLAEMVSSREVTRMARNGDLGSNVPITERILAIRERWHTKRHPFFLAFGEGKLPLKALGRYQALHYHFVSRALASFGLLYARGYHFEDVRKMIAENTAEEEGLKAIPEPGHEPHDHNELILRILPINRSLVGARVERISSAGAPEMCLFLKNNQRKSNGRC